MNDDLFSSSAFASTPSAVQPVTSPPLPHVPRHLGVILDGNRRWAVQRGMATADAYQMGATRVHELMTWCDKAGIRYVTTWALSLDNLRRGHTAVREISRVVTDELVRMASARRWRIRAIGAVHLLPRDQADLLAWVSRQTEEINGATLNVAIGYSGRDDIVAAVRTLIAAVPATDEITEEDISRHLSTAGQPDVDLVIRTSGERRLSGFMPWQAAQAELYFTEIAWPDFDRCAFDTALYWFARRDRRFGR